MVRGAFDTFAARVVLFGLIALMGISAGLYLVLLSTEERTAATIIVAVLGTAAGVAAAVWGFRARIGADTRTKLIAGTVFLLGFASITLVAVSLATALAGEIWDQIPGSTSKQRMHP